MIRFPLATLRSIALHRKSKFYFAVTPKGLLQAWEELRSNQGSMTAGIDATVATDIDPERIQRLSEPRKAGDYRPKPVQRVSLAKSNGKMRPSGLPDP